MRIRPSSIRFGAHRRTSRYVAAAIGLVTAAGVFTGVAQATSTTAAPAHHGPVASTAPAASSPAASKSAAVPTTVAPKSTCAALAQVDLTQIPGAPTTVMSAQVIAAGANTQGNWEACQITGLIAPQVQFQLLLPTQTYQGRYLQTGCGGYCGSVSISAPASTGCLQLTDGSFAVATDNEGHVGTSSFSAQFGADPQLRVDFGYRSEHLLATAAKYIIQQFYGSAPARSYFDGCSQGGHEGLVEAQRYPADFNGIIAGAPASIMTELNVFYQGWNALANTGANGAPILTTADLAPLHAAVVKACDGLDGTIDGLIAEPLACHFNPATLACASGQTSAAAKFCLTPQQVQTVSKLYSGPRDTDGQLLYPGWQLPGSELNWAQWVVPSGSSESGSIDYGIATGTMQFMVYPNMDTSRGLNQIKFTAANFKKLMSYVGGIYDATDPNLTAFRNDGGKLLMWQGLADPAISPVGTIAYYNAVEKYMGGPAKTQQFARLFMLPGVSHCNGGEGPDSFNGLGALVDWVEGHQAPSSLLTTKVQNGAVVSSRPVYQYPLVAVDTTGGPVNQASSYTAQQPPTPYNDSINWLGNFRSGYEQVCRWVNGKWVCSPGKAG